MHVRFLLIDGEPIIVPLNDKRKKERCFYIIIIIPKKQNLQEKLASSFEDISNNGFSVLDTKKVQKFI